MIYAILDKNKNLIYFSNKKRSEDDLDFTELLYTSNIVSLDDIKKDLRPIIYLKSTDLLYYKNVPEVKEYLETGKIHYYPYYKIYQRDIDREIDNFLEDYNFLCNLECCKSIPIYNEEIEEIKPLIKYDCDIYNYLESKFGKEVLDSIFLYRSLNLECKQFLLDFINIKTRDKKSDYVKNSIIPQNNPEVLEFLPLWYRLNYKILGNYKKNNEYEKLEYNRVESLGNLEQEDKIKEKIKDDFFRVFKLNMVFPGYEIKRLIQEIYDSNGLKKTAKISDLYDYFEITSVSSSSSYRIDLRK